jgi:hypothetical protein
MEGDKLHPVTGPGGVRLFDPAEVAAVAAALLRQGSAGARPASRPRSAARARGVPQEPPIELPRGELAARVFERLEQRQSLAEIVVGLRIAPEVVRELHREWHLGLVAGELARKESVVLVDDLNERERHVTREVLSRLLADLPMGTRTRLSIARNRGEIESWEDDQHRSARNVTELGGFHVIGPIELGEIARRYGRGDYRVTAYSFDPPGVRWEVFATIDKQTEVDALAAVELPAREPAALEPPTVRGALAAAPSPIAARANAPADPGEVLAAAFAELRTSVAADPSAARSFESGGLEDLARPSASAVPAVPPTPAAAPSAEPRTMLDVMRGILPAAFEPAADPTVQALQASVREHLAALHAVDASTLAELHARLPAAVTAANIDEARFAAELADVLPLLDPRELELLPVVAAVEQRGVLVALVARISPEEGAAIVRAFLATILVGTLDTARKKAQASAG